MKCKKVSYMRYATNEEASKAERECTEEGKKKDRCIESRVSRSALATRFLGRRRKKASKKNFYTTKRCPRRSRIVGIGHWHDRKPARPRLERRSPPLLVRRRPNQRRQGSFHQVAFHAPNPHQRVRHRWSPRIQPIRLVRAPGTGACCRVLVQTTPKRSRMRRRGTQARPLLMATPAALVPHHLVPRRHRNRPSGRFRPLNWEPHGRRRLGRGRAVQLKASGRRRSLKEIRGARVEIGSGGDRGRAESSGRRHRPL